VFSFFFVLDISIAKVNAVLGKKNDKGKDNNLINFFEDYLGFL
jgi:hypothetical protein